MVEDGDVATFPVVFFDGEREVNIGGVRIHQSLEFKDFQSGLSRMIGISPNQITVYLVDRLKPKSSTEFRRKIPITSKVNFAAIAKEIDCFFLVVLKRTRRSRRSKPKQGGVELVDCLPGNKLPTSHEKLLLLRRNQPELINPQVSSYVSPHYNQIVPPEFGDYNNRLQNLQIQRENYAMMMNSTAISPLDLDLDSFPRIEERFGLSPTMAHSRRFCEECANASSNGIPAPFHWCVFDTITVGFRSPAGPIARPRIGFR